ncbi:MAG TPA: diaminopimelate epimerase [Acetobacteraceae bacterium]|nr:diaminopimelate epimerase [Acetobacteraceae bacterium]
MTHDGAVRFVKAEANGNDFLIVDAEAVAHEQRSAFSRSICDRHRGVGADGVEFVRPHGTGFELELRNSDGGEAEISGNGTRCVAAFYAKHGFREGVLHTGAGPLRATVLDGEGAHWLIELEMGVPAIAGRETITALGRTWDATVLSVGNPQCVVMVPEFPENWEAAGAALALHPRFPHGTNVEFVQVHNRHHLEVRIFERGVGPTNSSGTGSCAAAIAAIVADAAGTPVEVATPGGVQKVVWAGPGAAVRLVGPASVVAEGMTWWHG